MMLPHKSVWIRHMMWLPEKCLDPSLARTPVVPVSSLEKGGGRR